MSRGGVQCCVTPDLLLMATAMMQRAQVVEAGFRAAVMAAIVARRVSTDADGGDGST